MNPNTEPSAGYRVAYTLSPVDHLLACLLLYTRGRFVLRSLTFGLILCVAIIAITGGFEDAMDRVNANWALFALVLLIGLSLPIVQGVFAMIVCVFTPLAKRSIVLDVSASGIRAVSQPAETTYKWAAFTRLFLLGDRAYAMLSGGASVPVPRRGLAEHGDWAGLITMLRDHIPANGQ